MLDLTTEDYANIGAALNVAVSAMQHQILDGTLTGIWKDMGEEKIVQWDELIQRISGRSNREMGAFKAKRTKRLKADLAKAKLRAS